MHNFQHHGTQCVLYWDTACPTNALVMSKYKSVILKSDMSQNNISHVYAHTYTYYIDVYIYVYIYILHILSCYQSVTSTWCIMLRTCHNTLQATGVGYTHNLSVTFNIM